MNKLFFLLVFISLAIPVFALENDSLLKKQKVKFYLGIGMNANIKHEPPFKYYMSELSYKWDGIIRDYYIYPKNSFSPQINFSLEKNIHVENEFLFIYSIDELAWMSQEKYSVKGIETVNSYSRAVTFETRNSFINNYVGLAATLLKKNQCCSYGGFIGIGASTLLYSRYVSEGMNNTDNSKINRVSEESIISDFNINLTLNPGLTIRYNLFKTNFSSQIYFPLILNKNRFYSNPFFNFPKLNCLTFFSTSILL